VTAQICFDDIDDFWEEEFPLRGTEESFQTFKQVWALLGPVVNDVILRLPLGTQKYGSTAIIDIPAELEILFPSYGFKTGPTLMYRESGDFTSKWSMESILEELDEILGINPPPRGRKNFLERVPIFETAIKANEKYQQTQNLKKLHQAEEERQRKMLEMMTEEDRTECTARDQVCNNPPLVASTWCEIDKNDWVTLGEQGCFSATELAEFFEGLLTKRLDQYNFALKRLHNPFNRQVFNNDELDVYRKKFVQLKLYNDHPMTEAYLDKLALGVFRPQKTGTSVDFEREEMINIINHLDLRYYLARKGRNS